MRDIAAINKLRAEFEEKGLRDRMTGSILLQSPRDLELPRPKITQVIDSLSFRMNIGQVIRRLAALYAMEALGQIFTMAWLLGHMDNCNLTFQHFSPTDAPSPSSLPIQGYFESTFCWDGRPY